MYGVIASYDTVTSLSLCECGVSIYQDETEAANYRGRRSKCIALFVSKTGSVCGKATVPLGSLLWIFSLQNSSCFGPSLHFLFLIRF